MVLGDKTPSDEPRSREKIADTLQMLNKNIENKSVNMGLTHEPPKLRMVSGPLNTVYKFSLSVIETGGFLAPLSSFQD